MLQVPRHLVDAARAEASNRRRTADEAYRREQVIASQWELFASLLEQGHELEESKRRAFRPRIGS